MARCVGRSSQPGDRLLRLAPRSRLRLVSCQSRAHRQGRAESSDREPFRRARANARGRRAARVVVEGVRDPRRALHRSAPVRGSKLRASAIPDRARHRCPRPIAAELCGRSSTRRRFDPIRPALASSVPSAAPCTALHRPVGSPTTRPSRTGHTRSLRRPRLPQPRGGRARIASRRGQRSVHRRRLGRDRTRLRAPSRAIEVPWQGRRRRSRRPSRSGPRRSQDRPPTLRGRVGSGRRCARSLPRAERQRAVGGPSRGGRGARISHSSAGHRATQGR